MPKKDAQARLMPYAVIGIIVIVGLILMYPKNRYLSQSPSPKPEKVTVADEFSQTEPKTATGVGEDQIAQAPFVFSVMAPVDGTTVKSSSIKVIGTTAPNSEVFVNDMDARADGKGDFSVSYSLEEGENYLIVGANDADGNSKEVEIDVTYEP